MPQPTPTPEGWPAAQELPVQPHTMQGATQTLPQTQAARTAAPSMATLAQQAQAAKMAALPIAARVMRVHQAQAAKTAVLPMAARGMRVRQAQAAKTAVLPMAARDRLAMTGEQPFVLPLQTARRQGLRAVRSH
jgi:hypothetical protein